MLTDAKLRSLKPKDAVFRVADCQGLCIEVRPSGSKIWRYRYRFAAKANMLSLGEYPGVTLAQARSEGDKHRALVKAGSNPVQVARIQRAAQMERAGNTFAVLADELMEKRAKKLTPGSVVRERRLLERDLGGFLGSLPIHEISAPLPLQALRKIEARGGARDRAQGACSSLTRLPLCDRYGPRDREPGDRLGGGADVYKNEALREHHRASGCRKTAAGDLELPRIAHRFCAAEALSNAFC